jgi:hypothetical protein
MQSINYKKGYSDFKGRVRKYSPCSDCPLLISETCETDMFSMPKDLARRSIFRVDTQLLNASWISAINACLDLLLSMMRNGMYPPLRSFGMKRYTVPWSLKSVSVSLCYVRPSLLPLWLQLLPKSSTELPIQA